MGKKERMFRKWYEFGQEREGCGPEEDGEKKKGKREALVMEEEGCVILREGRRRV